MTCDEPMVGHDYEVVELGVRPVGIICRICKDTWPVGDLVKLQAGSVFTAELPGDLRPIEMTVTRITQEGHVAGRALYVEVCDLRTARRNHQYF